MRCYHCHRHIRQAYYTQGGKTYGPECGKRLGLDVGLDARLWNSPVTKHKPIKVSARIKVEIQDGQVELFVGMTA